MFRKILSRTIVLVSLLSISILVPPFAAASATIRNIPPTPHMAPVGTSLSDIAELIKLAAADEGWTAVAKAPGLVRASLRVRAHKAIVAIHFDESNFWIEYQDSENLNFHPNDRRKTRTRRGVKGPRIHRNYNLWVSQLAKSIGVYATLPLEFNRRESPPSKSPLLIADELEKLDELRKRGVLSQEEFDQQKTKLLAQ